MDGICMEGTCMDGVCLEQYLHTFLDVAAFDDVAINGRQVAGTEPIRKIVTAVTASLNVIQKTIESGANCLITHHGLLMKGRVEPVERSLRTKLALLLQHDIHLYTYHLPIDAHEECGNVYPVAKMLGLTDLVPFAKGIGVIGHHIGIPSDLLYQRLKQLWRRDGSYVSVTDKSLKRIALVTGSGHRFLPEAISRGVDCFITGTSDEPVWHLAHEEKITFFAFGHAATEETGVRLLGEHLEKKFQLPHEFIHEKNPY